MEANETITKRYLISEDIGFLIDCSKVQLDESWAPYLEAVENLDPLVKNKEIRGYIRKKLNEGELVYPIDKRQLLRQHKILTFLTAGFMWQDGDQNVPERLPKCLSIPLFEVSKALGIKPILSYPSMILANWKMKDETEALDLENLEAILKTPGENPVAAEWFILVHVVIEYKFAPAIKAILEAMRCTCEGQSEENDKKLITALEVIPQVMESMVETFKRIKVNVDPAIFYDKLRIFYNGWGWGNPPLPEGLIYEGVDDEPQMMKGGSAAQSSTLQVIDAAFDINHTGDEEQFLTDIRDYMLVEHREFCSWVKKQSKIRDYAAKSSSAEVKDAYEKCIAAVQSFRKEHISKVNDYVKKPSERQDRNRSVEAVKDLGTGSTPYMTFLRNVHRDGNTSRLTVHEE